MMEGLLPEYGVLKSVRQPTGSRIATAAPSNAYPTSDGKSILIAGNSDPIFARLAKLLGLPELACEPRFQGNAKRVENVAELDAMIAAWTKNSYVHGPQPHAGNVGHPGDSCVYRRGDRR